MPDAFSAIRRKDGYLPIADHGLIGDGATAALEQAGLPGSVKAWRGAARRIARAILEQAWNAELGTLTAELGGALDASLLALPMRRLLAASAAFLGNFPQALSHVGLISSGFELASLTGQMENRTRMTSPSLTM
jgi:GH15 family glucan-1,4-alpha-glucosidase